MSPRDEGFGRIFDAKRAGDIDYLIAALSDPDHRVAAARYLGELKAVAAVPELMRLLDAGDPDVRTAAAQALGRIGPKDAVPRLIEVAAHDTAGPTRSYAIGALGLIGDPRAKNVLHDTLSDPEVWLRRSATSALERVGDQSSADLIS
jgi:HEAT repeat protein